MKRYKLLKSLPDCEAGAIYHLDYTGEDYVCYDNMSQGKWSVVYNKKYVENNPEWFELIPEPTEDKSFVWTDELVKEFIIDRNNGKPYAPVHVDKYIQQFKQSHSSTPPASTQQPKKEINLSIPLSKAFCENKPQEALEQKRGKDFYVEIPPGETILTMFTKEQMDEARRDAFNAARNWDFRNPIGVISRDGYPNRNELLYPFVHKTAEDYLKTINQK